MHVIWQEAHEQGERAQVSSVGVFWHQKEMFCLREVHDPLNSEHYVIRFFAGAAIPQLLLLPQGLCC